METLLSYNFDAADVADCDFPALFERRRRDALFVSVFRHDGSLFALRDHLGNVPLFYRYEEGRFRFATALTDLAPSGSRLNTSGVTAYLSFRTPKIVSPIEGVAVVPPGTVMRLDEHDGSVELLFRYKMKPVEMPALTRMRHIIGELEERFATAMQRQLKTDRVGLYLSGGMDSGLIGVWLKRMGAQVRAYTSAPWGKTSSEIPFALKNARIIGVDQHEIDYLESEQYRAALASMPELYGQPHGTSTGVGVANLWMNTGIAHEQQIFFGQNSDTMTCSVPAQSLIYFLAYLPRYLQRRFSHADGDALQLYFTFISEGLLGGYAPFDEYFDRLSRVQRLSAAGMYAVHSPSDGEVLAQPAIRHNIPVANPYYDLDLIEFCLGIPMIHRLHVSRNNPYLLALEKRVMRAFAAKYLPHEVIYRKKAFIVALDRDAETKQLVDTFPKSIGGVRANSAEQQFAAEGLRQWCVRRGIELDMESGV